MWRAIALVLSLYYTSIAYAIAQSSNGLQPCGDAFYDPSKYTCYDTNFLCPILNGKATLRCGLDCYLTSMYTCYNGTFLCPVQNGEKTLRCGGDCYLPSMYSCENGSLVLVQSPAASSTYTSSGANAAPSPTSSSIATGGISANATSSAGSSAPSCSDAPVQLHLPDPPYDNYFYSDCNTAAQVVITSPLPDSNLTLIGPRLLIAWPAGNSGALAYFAPKSGVNGSLGLSLVNGTENTGSLSSLYYTPQSVSDSRSDIPYYGVSGLIKFNDSAVLTIPILGSIRTIRDFTEGPSILVPSIQSSINFQEANSSGQEGGAVLKRVWLDNSTTEYFSFVPQSSNGTTGMAVTVSNRTLEFEAGTYRFSAFFDYPQLERLSPQKVFNNASQGLIQSDPSDANSLSFLSYTTKLLAGAWRFLTYFGRDTMISLLLLDPVLREGQGGPIEAGLAAVLERINQTDGSFCHEETIGDYATYLNLKANKTENLTAPGCDYKMVDTDFYLPILLDKYFLQTSVGQSRAPSFFNTTPSVFPENTNSTYGQLAIRTLEKIMNLAAPFAAQGNQTKDNLVHLKEGEIVGEWRDSTYGLGGGRIPYDVNTALMPAALRSIARLATAGFSPGHADWNSTADSYAKVWEDNTLQFFEVRVPASTAAQRVKTYVQRSSFPGPDETSSIDDDIFFYSVALDGNNNLSQVQVMNSDDCFRHFLLNTTNQTQLTQFVNQTANNIRRRFPVGLMTDVGVVVANPAYGEDPVYAANFTTSAYHGTVVWTWNSLAMMAKGLELQLSRCHQSTPPDFCGTNVLPNLRTAYNSLWDVIEANNATLSSEVWSWKYESGKFVSVPLGSLPPPAGVNPTESDVRQLWSLAFLGVKQVTGL